MREETALSESGYDPRKAERLMRELLAAPEAAVVCSHGKVLPELLGMAGQALRGVRTADHTLPKGGFAVLHRAMHPGATDPGPARVVSLERYTT